MRGFLFEKLKFFLGLLIFLSLLCVTAKGQEKSECYGKEININTATASEITENIPMISRDLAKKIVRYREENGEIQVLEELLQIEEFTQNLFKKVKPFLLLEDAESDDCSC